jgi:hypothetical protein
MNLLAAEHQMQSGNDHAGAWVALEAGSLRKIRERSGSCCRRGLFLWNR